jgi:methylation protein EvaC
MDLSKTLPTMVPCRICGGTVYECLDFGRQPLSNGFLKPEDVPHERYYRLAVGICTACTMVQQVHEVPRQLMFHDGYVYRASGSSLMRKHFEHYAEHLLATELGGEDKFLVEIGCNDGVMLRAIHEAGVRHLGVDPSGGAARVAEENGIRVRIDFFERATAADVRAKEGPADVIFSANTISHIPYLDSVFGGVDALLAPEGVFIFEDRYLGDIIARTYFDQIYDEHFYLFSVESVRAAAEQYGFQLVDAEHMPVHGGSIRYTVARPGVREPSASLLALLEQEREMQLGRHETFAGFAGRINGIRDDLVRLLKELHHDGKRILGYGATSKSATVTMFCGIDSELVPYICDTTPGKQGRLAPGSHIPVRTPDAFRDPYPDYALLFAWNHADEIMAKERTFREAGGRWILYVPDVHVV